MGRFFVFLGIIIFEIHLYAASTYVPTICRVGNTTPGALGMHIEKSCNILGGIKNVKDPYRRTYSDACVFKNSAWQIGKLVPVDPGTQNYRFDPEETCQYGVVARNVSPQADRTRGPRIGQAFYTAPEDKVSFSIESISSPAGVYKVFNSTSYFGAPDANTSVILKDVDPSEDTIIGCRFGDTTALSCVNSDPAAGPNDIGYCAARYLSNSSHPEGTVGGKSGRAYRGYWYVRYDQPGQRSFQICYGGIRVANAKDLANTNNANIQILSDVDRVPKATFLASYSDGASMTSGLIAWHNISPTVDKKYLQMSSCFVTSASGSATRYSCDRHELNVSAVKPAVTQNGSCYAYESSPGVWSVVFADDTNLLNCASVEIMKPKIVSPD